MMTATYDNCNLLAVICARSISAMKRIRAKCNQSYEVQARWVGRLAQHALGSTAQCDFVEFQRCSAQTGLQSGGKQHSFPSYSKGALEVERS